MNYESTITHESHTCPGVSFTVRRFTGGLRRELRRKLEPVHAKQRAIAQRRVDWADAITAAHGVEAGALMTDMLTPAEAREFDAFIREDDLVQRLEADPIAFDAGFVAVTGLTIDGLVPANSIAVRESGPPELADEILAAINREIGLTAAQIENLESPTTSAAAADGQTNGTSAAPASASDSTKAATAGDTSPTT
jgi:hypothetical protein